jgi:hypothetical protein
VPLLQVAPTAATSDGCGAPSMVVAGEFYLQGQPTEAVGIGGRSCTRVSSRCLDARALFFLIVESLHETARKGTKRCVDTCRSVEPGDRKFRSLGVRSSRPFQERETYEVETHIEKKVPPFCFPNGLGAGGEQQTHTHRDPYVDPYVSITVNAIDPMSMSV